MEGKREKGQDLERRGMMLAKGGSIAPVREGPGWPLVVAFTLHEKGRQVIWSGWWKRERAEGGTDGRRDGAKGTGFTGMIFYAQRTSSEL